MAANGHLGMMALSRVTLASAGLSCLSLKVQRLAVNTSSSVLTAGVVSHQPTSVTEITTVETCLMKLIVMQQRTVSERSIQSDRLQCV